MSHIKTSHDATGQSAAIVTRGSSLRFYADFSSGAGSAQLQCSISGEWLPVTESLTSTMDLVETADASSTTPMSFRWNVTVSSGTIVTYLA